MARHARQVVSVIAPEFNRRDGRKVTFRPKDAAALNDLKAHAPDWKLKALGLGTWTAKDGRIHWLFPAAWYGHIPEGYKVRSITGEVSAFARGVTSNDRRFGFLAFGWVRPAKPPMTRPRAGRR